MDNFCTSTKLLRTCASRRHSLHALWRCGLHAVQVGHRIQLRDCALRVLLDMINICTKEYKVYFVGAPVERPTRKGLLYFSLEITPGIVGRTDLSRSRATGSYIWRTHDMPPFQSQAVMPGIPISERMQIVPVCSRFTATTNRRYDQTPPLVIEQDCAGSAPRTLTESDDIL